MHPGGEIHKGADCILIKILMIYSSDEMYNFFLRWSFAWSAQLRAQTQQRHFCRKSVFKYDNSVDRSVKTLKMWSVIVHWLKESTEFHVFFYSFYVSRKVWDFLTAPEYKLYWNFGLFSFLSQLNIWIQAIPRLMQVPVFCILFFLFGLRNKWLLCVHLAKLFKQWKKRRKKMFKWGSHLTYHWHSIKAMLLCP